MTLKAICILATGVLALQSCRTSEPVESRLQESTSLREEVEEDPAPPIPANVPKGSMQKDGGVFTVLGLEIPSGMKPAKGPAKIFRFTGIIPVPQLMDLMREQIRPKWSKKSGTGHIYEEARVRRLFAL